MTDYNDGNWHGWNGGKCPVHPKSLVDYVWHDPRQETAGCGYACEAREDEGPRMAWAHVVKFRVVAPYVEPRTSWAVGKHLFDTRADADVFCEQLEAEYPGKGYDKRPIIKMVEVLE